MAASLLWILDAGNNTAMEPYRAFVADVLPIQDQRKGFMIQSFFTGLGITLANLCLYMFQKVGWLSQKSSNGLPYWVYVAFIIGAVVSITSVLWAMVNTKEYPPSDEELQQLKSEKRSFFSPFIDIARSIKDMPMVLWKLGLVYLFQWYAMFCYWQYSSLAIAKNVYHTSDLKSSAYEQAVGLTGLLNAIYNVVTFIMALVLMRVLKRYSAHKVHAFALVLAALGLIGFSFGNNTSILVVSVIGVGIAWASIMGVPYLIVVPQIPQHKYGIYMGIINMMIVIPMLLQTVSFGEIYTKCLNNNPTNAILLAATFMLIAGMLTLRLFNEKKKLVLIN